jgi:hypothetical protein
MKSQYTYSAPRTWRLLRISTVFATVLAVPFGLTASSAARVFGYGSQQVLAWTPDGQHLFTGGAEGINEWDVPTGALLRRITSDAVKCFAGSAAGPAVCSVVERQRVSQSAVNVGHGIDAFNTRPAHSGFVVRRTHLAGHCGGHSSAQVVLESDQPFGPATNGRGRPEGVRANIGIGVTQQAEIRRGALESRRRRIGREAARQRLHVSQTSSSRALGVEC